jgi:hypothetical protein
MRPQVLRHLHAKIEAYPVSIRREGFFPERAVAVSLLFPGFGGFSLFWTAEIPCCDAGDRWSLSL